MARFLYGLYSWSGWLICIGMVYMMSHCRVHDPLCLCLLSWLSIWWLSPISYHPTFLPPHAYCHDHIYGFPHLHPTTMTNTLLHAQCYVVCLCLLLPWPTHGHGSLICPLLCCLLLFTIAMTPHVAMNLLYSHYYADLPLFTLAMTHHIAVDLSYDVVCFYLLLPRLLTWMWISFMPTVMLLFSHMPTAMLFPSV